MRRQVVLRSPVRWRVSVRCGVLVAAAGLAAAACAPVQMGAAAVIGSGRISDSTVAGQVMRLSTAYQADKARAQLTYTTAQMPRLTLIWLVRFRIRDELAAQQRVAVTPGEIQRALSAIGASVRQGGQTLSQAATGAGLPPDLLTDLGRYVAIQNKLVTRLNGGTPPASQAAGAAAGSKFSHLECVAAKGLHIKISPQFGAFDYSQFSIVPVPSTLAAGPGGPAKRVKAQLTPPC